MEVYLIPGCATKSLNAVDLSIDTSHGVVCYDDELYDETPPRRQPSPVIPSSARGIATKSAGQVNVSIAVPDGSTFYDDDLYGGALPGTTPSPIMPRPVSPCNSLFAPRPSSSRSSARSIRSIISVQEAPQDGQK